MKKVLSVCAFSVLMLTTALAAFAGPGNGGKADKPVRESFDKKVEKCVEAKMNERTRFDRFVDKVVPNMEKARAGAARRDCELKIAFPDKGSKK